MSFTQQQLNTTLINNTDNITIVNTVIQQGANDFYNALLQAIKNNNTAAITVLKSRATKDEVLLAASCGGNTELVSEFYSQASNHEICCVQAAIRNKSNVFDLLKSFISANCGMLCATYLQKVSDIESFYSDGADNYNECAVIAAKIGNSDLVAKFIDYGANNQLELYNIANSRSDQNTISLLLGI